MCLGILAGGKQDTPKRLWRGHAPELSREGVHVLQAHRAVGRQADVREHGERFDRIVTHLTRATAAELARVCGRRRALPFGDASAHFLYRERARDDFCFFTHETEKKQTDLSPGEREREISSPPHRRGACAGDEPLSRLIRHAGAVTSVASGDCDAGCVSRKHRSP